MRWSVPELFPTKIEWKLWKMKKDKERKREENNNGWSQSERKWNQSLIRGYRNFVRTFLHIFHIPCTRVATASYKTSEFLPSSIYFLLFAPRTTETGTGIIGNTSQYSVVSGVHCKQKIEFIFSLISFSEISFYLFFHHLIWSLPSKMAIVRVLDKQFHQIQSKTSISFQLCIIIFFWCGEWNVIQL